MDGDATARTTMTMENGGGVAVVKKAPTVEAAAEPEMVSIKRTKQSGIDVKRVLRNTFPIIGWLPQYTVKKFLRDLLAGFTVGLTLVPQSIAYASVAGIPLHYGLYTAIMGPFVYTIFGTVPEVNVGPSAMLSLLTQDIYSDLGMDGVILITFWSGCLVFLFGLLHLGFVIEFFSYPVVSGFTCAAAINIGASQLKSLFGINGSADDFLDSINSVIKNITDTNYWDLVLGCTSIIFLIIMKESIRLVKRSPEDTIGKKVLNNTVWFISTARNAVIVLLCMLMAYLMKENGRTPFTLIDDKDLDQGLPKFVWPPFTTTTEEDGKYYSFSDMFSTLGSALAFIPLVSILETVAVGKQFTKGKRMDATQELVTLGICNLTGSFLGSMTVSGSFSRTAINHASGVATQMAGVVTGSLVLIALALLTDMFTYIPKSALAAVIIATMIYLFDVNGLIYFWKTKKLDLVPFGVTFLASLFLGIQYGILTGIAVHLIFIMYPTARPKVRIYRRKVPQGEVVVVEPPQYMQFPVAEYFKEKILFDCNFVRTPVAIDGSDVRHIDSSVSKCLQELVIELKARGQMMVFWNFKEKIISVCTNAEPALAEYCRYGRLEDVIDDPSAKLPEVSVEVTT